MSTSSICILFVNIMHTWTWTYALLHLSVSVCDCPPTGQRVNILASCVSNCGTLLLGRLETWDCIIAGKAATLTSAYNGIVVRQGSRFLGLPKAIAQSFSWSHPYLTFIRTKTAILQFRLEKALISKIWKTCTRLFDPEMRGVFNLKSRHTSFWVDATLTLECERHGIYQCLSLVQKIETKIFMNTCHFPKTQVKDDFLFQGRILVIVSKQPLTSLVFLQFFWANCLQC